jgi:hypothetical protein
LFFLGLEFCPLSDGVVSLDFAPSKPNHDDLQDKEGKPATCCAQQYFIVAQFHADDFLVFVFYYFAVVFVLHSSQGFEDL